MNGIPTGYMTEDLWKFIRYFQPNEWGNWRKVKAALIFHADELRHQSGHPLFINLDSKGVPVTYATSGHSEGSAHYRGEAVDLHSRHWGPVDLALIADRMDKFGGIGLYPAWNNPGCHLDIAEPGRRWIRNASGIYVPVTWENLKAYC